MTEVEVQKLYYSYEQIHSLVRNISEKIKQSNYNPDIIIAVGGGGYIPARILRTYLKVPLIGISLNFYNNCNQVTEKPTILQWIQKSDINNKNILIVDEVDDTRKTLDYIMKDFEKYEPKNISIAVIHNKNKNKITNFDDTQLFVGEEVEDKWIVYPWDIQ